MQLEDARTLIARETRISEGAVPASLDGVVVEADCWHITPDAFLMRAQNLISFYYRRGHGVVFQRRPEIPDATVELFYHGSVHGAIAWISGFVPLHASAVVQSERIVAFTGDSGAGKSTTVAGLASPLTPLFADDVLILDLRDPETVTALPGHKMLKLCGDAFDMLGAERGLRVYPGLDKFFAVSPHRSSAGALPLGMLYFLGEGEMASSKMTGGERFGAISSALYRPEYALGAGLDFSKLFALRARLAVSVPMMRLSRPRSHIRFAESTAFVRHAMMAGFLQSA